MEEDKFPPGSPIILELRTYFFVCLTHSSGLDVVNEFSEASVKTGHAKGMTDTGRSSLKRPLYHKGMTDTGRSSLKRPLYHKGMTDTGRS